MRIFVYVEGPADRDALPKLLSPLVAASHARKVTLRFIPTHGKAALLDSVSAKAANEIRDHPDSWIFALPDLYPMAPYAGTRNAHASFPQLHSLLRTRFIQKAEAIGLQDALRNHFRVHCLKHDLEVLLLAAPEQLKSRLKTTDLLRDQWRRPVEDHDDGDPPKRVVERLFRKYREKPDYVETVDAGWILERADLDTVVAATPQRFAPFVEELRILIGGGGLI